MRNSAPAATSAAIAVAEPAREATPEVTLDIDALELFRMSPGVHSGARRFFELGRLLNQLDYLLQLACITAHCAFDAPINQTFDDVFLLARGLATDFIKRENISCSVEAARTDWSNWCRSPTYAEEWDRANKSGELGSSNGEMPSEGEQLLQDLLRPVRMLLSDMQKEVEQHVSAGAMQWLALGRKIDGIVHPNPAYPWLTYPSRPYRDLDLSRAGWDARSQPAPPASYMPTLPVRRRSGEVPQHIVRAMLDDLRLLGCHVDTVADQSALTSCASSFVLAVCKLLAPVLDGCAAETPPNSGISDPTPERTSSDEAEDVDAGSGPEQSDGPFLSGLFGFQGEVIRGCPRLPWRLIHFLWNKPEMSAEISDLADPVWKDKEEPVDRTNVHSVCKRANQFFRKHALPFRTQVSGDSVSLIRESINTGSVSSIDLADDVTPSM